MNINEIKNYTVDTAATIESSPAGSAGSMAFASDKKTLYISDGSSWVKRGSTHNNDKHTMYSVETQSTPYLHFDADVSSSLLNNNTQVNDGQYVTRWENQTGSEDLVASFNPGKYVANDSNGNAAIDMSGLDAGMWLDPECMTPHVGEFTFISVHTPLSAGDTMVDDRAASTAGIRKNRQPVKDGVNNVFNTQFAEFIDEATAWISFDYHHAGSAISNRVNQKVSTFMDYPHETQPVDYSTLNSVYLGQEKDRVEIHNTHFLNNTQIVVVRCRSNHGNPSRNITEFWTPNWSGDNHGQLILGDPSRKLTDTGATGLVQDYIIGKDGRYDGSGSLQHHEIIGWNTAIDTPTLNQLLLQLKTKWNITNLQTIY